MAVIKRSTLLDGLEPELTCPVCMDIFQKPLKLPCEHDLCLKCADNLLKSQTSREGRRPRKFRCPECREKIRLGDRGVHSLRRNVRLQNIIDRFVANSRVALEDSLKTNIGSKYEGVTNHHSDKWKVTSDIKEALTSEIGMISSANKCVGDHLAEMNKLRFLIDRDAMGCEKTLGDEIKELIDLLYKRKADLIKKIHRKQREKIKYIDDRIAKCQEALDDGKQAVTRCEDLLQNIDNDSYLKDFQTLRQSIISTKITIDKCLQEPLVEPGLGIEMDFKLQKDVIQMLDVVSNEPAVRPAKLKITVPGQTNPIAKLTVIPPQRRDLSTNGSHIFELTTPARIPVPEIPRVPMVTMGHETLGASSSAPELHHMYLMPRVHSPGFEVKDDLFTPRISTVSPTSSSSVTLEYRKTPKMLFDGFRQWNQ